MFIQKNWPVSTLEILRISLIKTGLNMSRDSVRSGFGIVCRECLSERQSGLKISSSIVLYTSLIIDIARRVQSTLKLKEHCQVLDSMIDHCGVIYL